MGGVVLHRVWVKVGFLEQRFDDSSLRHFGTTPDSRLPLMSFTMTGRKMSRYSITSGSTVD